MPSLYNSLRSNTVPRLLAKFNTGVVEIGRPVTTVGVGTYDPPTTTTTWTRVDAVVTGVSQRYIDGVNVVGNERMVIFQSPTAFDPAAGDKLRIDGKVAAIVRLFPVLAAGDPVMEKVMVR